MRREIYIVSAAIVDANGTYNALSGYPKTFDSRTFPSVTDPAETARLRAYADWHTVLGAMYPREDRQLQTAAITRLSDGIQIERAIIGALAPTADPEE